MYVFLDAFEAGFDRLLGALAASVAVSIGLMALLIPLNLLLVRFQLGSFWWLFGSVEYALYFGVFAASPWALRQGAHVRIELLSQTLKPRLAIWLDTCVNLIGIAICLALCIYGVRGAIEEFIDAGIPDRDLRIANWIIVSAFALSFALCAIEFALRLRRSTEPSVADENHANGSGA